MSKSLTNFLLSTHGINVPKQKLFFIEDLSCTNEFIVEIKYPVCLKPNNLSESKDVYPNIQNREELDRVIAYYKTLHNKFVIEKRHLRNAYRLYYCYGKVLVAIQK